MNKVIILFVLAVAVAIANAQIQVWSDSAVSPFVFHGASGVTAPDYSQAHSGSASIGVVPSGYGWFIIAGPTGYISSQIQSLDFYLYSTIAAPSLNFGLTTGSSQYEAMLPGGSIPANQWVHINMPISLFSYGLYSGAWDSLSVYTLTSNPSAKVYFDDISFLTTASTGSIVVSASSGSASVSSSGGSSGSVSSSGGSSGPCPVTVTQSVTNAWPSNGQQVSQMNVVLTNVGSQSYSVQLTFSGPLQQFWNLAGPSGNVYSLPSYNPTLSPGSSYSFGYIAQSVGSLQISLVTPSCASDSCTALSSSVLTFISNSSGSILSLPAGSLSAGSTFTFRVVVTSIDGISSTVLTSLTTIAGAIPIVQIQPLRSSSVLVTEQLVLSGSSSTGSYSWITSQGDVDVTAAGVAASGIHYPQLIIAAGSLNEGSTYTIRLIGTSSTGVTAFAEITFTTSKAPFGGSVIVDPSSGVGLFTNFTITTSDWIVQNNPLSYQMFYAYFTSGGDRITSDIPLSSRQLSDSLTVLLPVMMNQNYSHVQITVQVSDSFGAIASASSSLINLNSAAVDFDYLLALARSYESDGDINRELTLFSSIASLPDLTDDQQATLIQSTVSAFYQPTSPSDLALESQVLSAVTSNLNQSTSIDQVIIDSVDQMIDFSSNILDQMPADVINYLIGTLSNIIDQDDLPSSIDTQVQDLLQDLMSFSITSLPCNDHAQFDSDNIHASVAVLCDKPDPVIPLCPISYQCAVEIPPWFYNETTSNSDGSTTINVTVIADSNHTVHLNFSSDRYDTSLPSGGRFNVTFNAPVSSASNSVAKCSSSEDGGQSWDSDACETVDSDGDAGTITCSCSRSTQVQAHFVSIANLEASDSSEPPSLPLIKIVVPAAGGLLAIIVIIALLVRRARRRSALNRVDTMQPPESKRKPTDPLMSNNYRGGQVIAPSGKRTDMREVPSVSVSMPRSTESNNSRSYSRRN